MRFGLTHLAVSALALAAVAVPAQAVTITQTLNFGPSTTDYNQTKSFNLFDSTLGVLNSISLSDSYGINSDITLTNSAASASNGTVRAEGMITFTLGNVLQQAALNGILGDDNVDFFTAQQTYMLMPGESMQLNTARTVNEAAVSSSVPAYLLAFSMIGGGTGTVSGQTFTQTLLGNQGGNTSASQVTQGTGAFTIVYDYSAVPPVSVPEPAMVGLFGLGALGLGLSRRRRAA